MANTLVNVEGYLQDNAVHILDNSFCITKTLNPEYEGYDNLQGTLGPKFLVNLPTRTVARKGFGFTANGTDGQFSQRSMSVTADQEGAAEFPYSDIDSALFDKNKGISQAAMSNLTELANQFEGFYADKVSTAGYRFIGSPAVLPGQMQTVQEVTQGDALFESFGCVQGTEKHWIMPMVASAKTVSSGLQEFAPKRNNELALNGEIGVLGGVRKTVFCRSNLLPVHTAGTAADNVLNLSSGYTITSVTPTNAINPDDANGDNTSTIVLSGMTNGETILADDMLDIGVLNAANPLRYLTFSGYHQSETTVQCRVVTGDTVAGGVATILVQPALIFDATNLNAYRNLNRDIIAGTDTIRFVKSHRSGCLYFGQYGFRVNPLLPDAEPYPSSSIKNQETGIAIRAFYGRAGVGNPFKYFVHESLYGFGAASEGFARVIYPLV